MFKNQPYLTKGVNERIPLLTQLFLWNLIENMSVEKDYAQFFYLSEENGRPKKAIPDNFFDECRKWLEGEQTAVITMKKTGLKKTTFYRMVNENMREISVKC